MARGTYELRRTSAATKEYVNVNPTPLHRSERDGHITARQREAGLRFEEMHARAWHAPVTRDPLDPSVRGGVVYETEEQIDWIARNKARLNTLQRLIGSHAFGLVRDLAVYRVDWVRFTPRSRQLLVQSLDDIANWLGLE
jgi:hypothetical protein